MPPPIPSSAASSNSRVEPTDNNNNRDEPENNRGRRRQSPRRQSGAYKVVSYAEDDSERSSYSKDDKSDGVESASSGSHLSDYASAEAGVLGQGTSKLKSATTENKTETETKDTPSRANRGRKRKEPPIDKESDDEAANEETTNVLLKRKGRKETNAESAYEKKKKKTKTVSKQTKEELQCPHCKKTFSISSGLKYHLGECRFFVVGTRHLCAALFCNGPC